LGKLLVDGEARSNMLNTFGALIDKLGGGGASEKTAKLMIDDLKSS